MNGVPQPVSCDHKQSNNLMPLGCTIVTSLGAGTAVYLFGGCYILLGL